MKLGEDIKDFFYSSQNINSNTSRIKFITKIYIWSVVIEPLYMFVLVPRSVVGISGNFSRILQLIVVASLCLKLFSSKRVRDRIFNSFSMLNNNITYYFIFAILVGILGFYTGSYSLNIESSTIVSNSIIAKFHQPPIRPLFEYIIAFYYFVYFVVLALYMLTSKEAIDYFFRIFGIALLLCLVLGYIDYLYMLFYYDQSQMVGYLLPRHLWDGHDVGLRFHGIAGEPRDAFSYLMLCLGMFALRDIWEDKKKLTLFWIVFIVITAMLTQSLSGLIGITFFGFLLFIYFFPKASLKVKLLSILFVLLAAVLIYLNIMISFRLTVFLASAHKAYLHLEAGTEIINVWSLVMNNVYPIWHLWLQIKEFEFLPLIIGNGLGSVSIVNNYYMEHTGITNPNAFIIKSLYETGVIGTLLFVAAFLGPIKKMYINNIIYSKLILFMLLMLGMYFAHKSAIPYIFLGVVLVLLKNKLITSDSTSQQ